MWNATITPLGYFAKCSTVTDSGYSTVFTSIPISPDLPYKNPHRIEEKEKEVGGGTT